MVALYCGTCLVLPRWHDPEHTYDVDITHLVMGALMEALMATMLNDALPHSAEAVTLVLFGATATWFGVRSLRRHLRTTHLSLGVASVAMFYMLVPQAASANVTTPVHAHAHDAAPEALRMTAPAGSTLSLLGFALIIAMIVVAVGGCDADDRTRALGHVPPLGRLRGHDGDLDGLRELLGIASDGRECTGFLVNAGRE